MNSSYEYEGHNLNTPVIRGILFNHLTLPVKWLSVNDFEERIVLYHQQNEGEPTELINLHSAVYGVLRELERNKRVESRTEAGQRYYRLIPSDVSKVESLLRVIREERERLDEQIEALSQRRDHLDIILREYD